MALTTVESWLTGSLEGTLEAVGRVREVLPLLARAADEIARRLDSGGRLIYAGAGSSGRIATLDAAELPPTFGTPPELVSVLMAGGPGALTEAVEGAEDDGARGAAEVDALGVGPRDALLGIAASGATPYVLGAVRRARERSALTLGLCGVPGSPLWETAEIALVVDAGTEEPRGSTRMKAGTVQKVVLNLLSTAVMTRRGLVWRGEMVAMRPTNRKLRDRARRIVRELLDASPERAEELLTGAGWELPVALVTGRHCLAPAEARAHLATRGGNVARALEEEPRS